MTPEAVRSAASGWDGFSFVGFVDRNDSLALAGISAWDTPEDAEEFSALFQEILTRLHGEGGFGVRATGNRVSFVVGFENELTEKILSHH